MIVPSNTSQPIATAEDKPFPLLLFPQLSAIIISFLPAQEAVYLQTISKQFYNVVVPVSLNSCSIFDKHIKKQKCFYWYRSESLCTLSFAQVNQFSDAKWVPQDLAKD